MNWRDFYSESLEMYQAWLQPSLARVIAEARKHTPDILVMYHI